MKTITGFYRAAVACAVIAVASPAWARQAAPPDDPAKPQVETFEMVLGTAVEKAVQNFAKRVPEMAPQMAPQMRLMAFSLGEAPIVNGVADHEMGLYVFQVQVPGIGLTLQVMNMLMSREDQVQASARPGGAQTVANRENRVSADGTVPADPVGPGSELPLPNRSNVFEQEYRAQVRESLIDAILDNSGGLPLGATDTLLVVASGTEPGTPNSLYREPSKKLMLKVKGVDLADFRQGKITREDAKQRIKESSF